MSTHALEDPKPPLDGVQGIIAGVYPNQPVMERVAAAESEFSPSAKSSTSSAKGVFQILDGTWKAASCTGNPYDAYDNAVCAKRVYEREGLGAWEASRNKWDK